MRTSAPPNVVGYPLDEARAALAQAGWDDVGTTETQPPRRGLLGPYRVLRQRTTGGRITLVVSGERSERTASSVVDGAGSRPAAPTADAAAASDQGNDVAGRDARA
jgi:hypothetical protein